MTRQFLSGFTRIFTINHDLLLYWAVNRSQSKAQPPPQADGFRPSASGDLVWSKANPQAVYWLHGGLHLYTIAGSLIKLRAAASTTTLISDIAARIAARQYPLLVLEGTTLQKRNAIAGSPYLTEAYDQLGALACSVVVLGVGVSPQDSHIRERIATSSVSHVLVGIWPSSGDSATIRREWTGLTALRGPGQLSVHFFDTSSVALW